MKMVMKCSMCQSTHPLDDFKRVEIKVKKTYFDSKHLSLYVWQIKEMVACPSCIFHEPRDKR